MNHSPTQELQRIKSSRSWRYTAPIRLIYDSFWRFFNLISQPKSHIQPKHLPNNKNISTLISSQTREWKTNVFVCKIKELSNVKFENTPKASIIIPCYNQIEYTASAVLSILESKSKLSYEIILADDFSLIDDYKIFRDISPLIKVIRPNKNQGFLKNCNFAADHAQGEYLVFLNNDCLPVPGWLDSLVQTAESDSSIGIVGSKLLNTDGSLQEAGGIIWRDASGWNYGRGKNPLAPEYNYTKEVDYCTGASFCIRKSIWSEMGGFDEHFAPAYYEETDLSFRLRAKGYKTVYQPNSLAIHLEGISNGTDLGAGMKRHQVVNREKFLQRWHEVLERDHFVNGSHERFARDRSKYKRHMLFIDHYLPEYDRDAGSKQMLAYLRLFQKSDYQITFWSDNQIYNPIYASSLENIGIEVINSRAGWIDFSHWMQKNGKYLDVAFLSRPHIAKNYFDEIRKHSKCKVVYYGHDLHLERMNLQNSMVPGTFCDKTLNSVKKMEDECWEKSDVILYPSVDEVNFLRGKYPHRKVEILPIECRAVDETKAKVTPSGFGTRNGLLFVGGFAHPPNQDAIIWFLNEVFPLLEGKHTDLKITIAGNAPTEEIMGRADDKVTVTGRVSEEELRSLYNKAKVVVAPLRIGAGVKGKVVEALRMGVPIVTTSIGVQGLPGFEDAISTADDPADFSRAVTDLLQDEAVWQRRREEGMKFFVENFAESVVAPRVMELLDSQ